MKKFGLFGKIISLLIVMSLLFSMMLLVGCKKKNNDDDDDDTPAADGGYKNEKAEEGRADFIAELGGVSDTYKGAVSEQSYDTPETAAVAFVTEEIVGGKDVSIAAVTPKSKLSTTEIDALNLPADVKEGIVGVNKLEVTYSTSNPSAQGDAVIAPCAVASNDTVVIVYVIKYENAWKYYSPAPVTGKTITKSYYDSVFNYEKYKNCTLETEMALSMNVVGTDGTETHTIDMEVTAKQLIKHADGKVYAEMYTKTVAKQDGQTQTNEQYIYLYIEDKGDVVDCYVKMSKDGAWLKGSLNMVGFSDIDELTPFYDQYLDYTYFTKTSFGFAIEEKNAKLYLAEVMSDLEDMFPGAFSQNDMGIDMYAEYYVANGVLTGMRSDASVSFSLSEDGITADATEAVVSSTKVSNYGTTVIDSPVD